MQKNIINIFILIILALNFNGFAADNINKLGSENKQEDSDNRTELQKVTDDYKAYLTGITAELREEIITYRKEIAKINRQKIEAYKKLSQEAQNYLAKEQEFKKRLPLKQRKLINMQNSGEKPKLEEIKE